VYHFQTIPLISFVSNLLVGPWFALVLLLSFAVTILGLWISLPSLLVMGVQCIVSIFLGFTHFCAELPFGTIKTIVPSWYVGGLYYAVLFGIRWCKLHTETYPRVVRCCYKKGKKLLVLVCLAMCVLQGIRVGTREFTITMIDVGQGDSTCIQTKRGTTILIDGGGEKEGSDFKVGDRITVPYLLHQKIYTIEYMLVSHFDSDHSAGLLSVLENCHVKTVIVGEQAEESYQYTAFCALAEKKKCRVVKVKKGDVLRIDKDTSIEILSPGKKLLQENPLNNNSLVCKLKYGAFSMLFTGDIEKIAEEKLVQEYEGTDVLKATVLKVAHHGSKGSSTEAFLEKTKARVAFIGVGKGNHFGHPGQETLERLETYSMKIFRTDIQGALTLKVKKNGSVRVATYISE